MLASRIKLAENYDRLGWGNMWPMTTEKSMQKQCQKDVRIFREMQNNPEIRKRAMIIRYEDMTMRPWKKAGEIYKFLGIPFDQKTKAQFRKGTGIKRRRKRNAEEDRKKQLPEKNSAE